MLAMQPPVRLQFSLATLFALMTLAAVGVWYWYQWPFEVENKQYGYGGVVDPFAAPGAVTPNPPPLVRREVESVRRVFGGGTIRHGPRRVYDAADNLISVENYRNGQRHGAFLEYDPGDVLTSERHYVRGVLHGRYFRTHANGKKAVEGAYDHGRTTGKWSWLVFYRDPLARESHFIAITGEFRDGFANRYWECRDESEQPYLTMEFNRGRLISSSRGSFDTGLEAAIARAAFDDPELMVRLFIPITVDFQRMVLFPRGFASFLDDLIDVPIYVENRQTVAQIDPWPRDARVVPAGDLYITCKLDRMPLITALYETLSPSGLACDWRYGGIWIDKADAIKDWKDPTGVSQIVPPPASRLAGEWNKKMTIDVVEMPLHDVCLYLRDTHEGNLQFDLSYLPTKIDSTGKKQALGYIVTMSRKGSAFKDCLGYMLYTLDLKGRLAGETIVIEPQ
jgi:hypothetical protein